MCDAACINVEDCPLYSKDKKEEVLSAWEDQEGSTKKHSCWGLKNEEVYTRQMCGEGCSWYVIVRLPNQHPSTNLTPEVALPML